MAWQASLGSERAGRSTGSDLHHIDTHFLRVKVGTLL